MGKEFSQKTIRRILREETQIPISVMRRLKLNRMPDMMKSYSLREFKGMTKELIIQTAALRSAKELLPWHDERGIDYDDDEYQRWVNLLTEYFIETYGNETLKYFEKVLPSGSFDYDGNRYTFIKHSEYIGGNGFSESYFTWADLMEKRGWWFPIDWWDVKDKLDKIDDGRVTFLRPGEPHNTMGYYFSIYKKKINLEESVIKILRESNSMSDKIKKQINEFGIYGFMKLSGMNWEKITSLIGVDFLSYKMMLDFIKDVVENIGGISLPDIGEDPIQIDLTSSDLITKDELTEIVFLGARKGALVSIWGGYNFEKHLGDFIIEYHKLPDDVLEQIFEIVIKVYEQNK